MRSAEPIACAPEAHAELTANDGPRRPWRIDSAPAPALLIISGTDSGETCCGAAFAQRVLAVDERGDAADAGAEHAADALGLVWMRGRRRAGVASPALVLPARVGERLGAGGDRELREAVGAARLLGGEEVARVEVRARPLAVGDAALAGAPALVQRARADAERRDRAHSGDDDRLHRYSREAISWMASSTVLTSATSEPFSSTPKCSCTICESSARSSESMSSASNVASGVICAGSAPKVCQRLDHDLLDLLCGDGCAHVGPFGWCDASVLRH